MNARELLDDLESGLIDEFMSAEVKAIYIRALRLLAAAEANDGTTPETDAAFPLSVWPADFACDFARRLERERNGLAARVAELEKELQAHRVHLVEAIYGQPCPTPRQWDQMQEVAVKAMGARGSKP